MARYLGPVCKLSRRSGVDLEHKSGVKPYEEKCRSTSLPGKGVQGGGSARLSKSEYCLHLREKQKLRWTYNILERQFLNYFKLADKQKGATGEILVRLLEARLDNVIYRLGFAVTRSQARQLVRHGHVLIDGKRVNIPSFQVGTNQVVGLSTKAKEFLIVKDASSRSESFGAVPSWLTVDFEKLSGKIVAWPSASQAAPKINTSLIVEYYSR